MKKKIFPGAVMLLAIVAIASATAVAAVKQKGGGKLERYTNSIGMEFVLIPAGTFTMGSPESEPERWSNETQHKVTISRSFYMQTTEVTQGQWKRVMGSNPSHFKDCGDECPVERVSWNNAQKFILKLNEKGEPDKYRLPTQAEWEYAARAGTTTPFNTGRCLNTDKANYHGGFPLKGCSQGEPRNNTIKVGSFAPNAWGLYDMHGNVSEWCQDFMDWNTENASGHVTDPGGLSSGPYRISLGGSWYDHGGAARSANYTGRFKPNFAHYAMGFRLLRIK